MCELFMMGALYYSLCSPEWRGPEAPRAGLFYTLRTAPDFSRHPERSVKSEDRKSYQSLTK